MKKVICLILTLAVVGLIMVGCSSNSTTPPAPSDTQNNSSNSNDSAPAKDYPTKPIEIINPSAAGGETDIYGRLFARYMEKELGQPLVTVNMAGGGGTISTNEVDNSDPDGYRVLTFHNGFIINNLMDLSKLDVDSFEIAAIPIIDGTQMFFAAKNAPYNDVKELVEYVQAGNSVNVATEVGSFTHFQLLALEKAAGVKFNIVDAGTTPEKITALLAGNIDVMGTNYATGKDYIANGDFKPLGLLSDERNSAFKDIPTFKELGYDVVFDKFFFFAFPKGTDKAIVKKFNDAAMAVGKNPEFIAEVKKFNASASTMTADEAYDYMKKIQESYAAISK
jgi:tripartite-type tricarboxylate transporter receptor subunit TctC